MPASDLPEDVRAVGRQVREIAPSLRKAGIDIRPPQERPAAPAAHHARSNDDPGPKNPVTSSSSGIRKDMSHMSHGRITAGQQAWKVGH